MEELYLIIGLGNPGKDYEKTRHNVGFDVVEELSERHSVPLNKAKFNAVFGEGRIGSKRVFLVKPTTYMNNSGQAVRQLMDFYKLEPDSLCVVLDDIDIDFSQVRVKRKGSAGTHNGMKSIIYHLGCDEFTRVKLGVGKKHEGEDLAKFVLSRFSQEQRSEIDKCILRAADAVECWLQFGVDRAMNEFNISLRKE